MCDLFESPATTLHQDFCCLGASVKRKRKVKKKIDSEADWLKSVDSFLHQTIVYASFLKI